MEQVVGCHWQPQVIGGKPMDAIKSVGSAMPDPIRESVSAAAQEAKASPAVPRTPELELPKKAVLAAPETTFDPKQMQARLQEAVDQLNEQLSRNDTALRFGIDNRISRFVVTVRSSESGEVVRQIPGEDILRVAHKIEDLKGILYSKDA